MLKKFVWFTGLTDFLVGIATFGGAIQLLMAPEPVKGQFVPLMTLGMFLCMAAALLMWASHDMKNRAPVMVWQGLVRLVAVAAVLYSVPNGLSVYKEEMYLLFWDGPIGLVYIIGAMKVTGCSLPQVILCKTDPKQ
jgi:hypothetical protein